MKAFVKVVKGQMAPPNYKLSDELLYVMFGFLASGFFSFLFIGRFLEARGALFWYNAEDSIYVLIPDAQMVSFHSLMQHALDGFELMVGLLFVLAVFRYLSYQQGGKNLYLMRRLPDRTLWHRLVWQGLLVYLVGIVLCCLVLVLVYYGIYYFGTPKQCLPMNGLDGLIDYLQLCIGLQ